MAGSLIDQMNVLKGLSDQSLATELAQPTGGAAPFMVLSEVNRRKDMRQRYAGQMAQRKPSTTVVQDQLSALAPPPGAAAGQGAPVPPALAGGIGSPPPMPASPGAPMPPAGIATPGYANGGIVGYADGGSVDYGQIADQYAQQLQQEQKQREMAPWLALINAGASMAGGTSPNALTNIGQGISAGVNAYSSGQSAGSTQSLNTLRGMSDLANLQQSQKTQAADLALRQGQYGLEQQKFTAAQDPNNVANQPASVREYDYLKTLAPEQQDQFMQIASPYAARAGTSQDNKAAAAFASVFNRVKGQIAKKYANDFSGTAPDENQISAEAYAQAVEQYRALYPQWSTYADQYAQSGTNNAAAPAAPAADPLGLGL